jgi:hypothetical protein
VPRRPTCPVGGRWWGVDGAKTGAAVRMDADGLTALELIEWRDRDLAPPLDIRPGDVVALEQAYLGKSALTFRRLVEWRARFKSTLPVGVVLVEPLAVTWRAKVLRVARIPRGKAKALAVAAATANARGLPAEPTEDAAEGWCLARWAWAWDRAGRPAGPGVP